MFGTLNGIRTPHHYARTLGTVREEVSTVQDYPKPCLNYGCRNSHYTFKGGRYHSQREADFAEHAARIAADEHAADLLRTAQEEQEQKE